MPTLIRARNRREEVIADHVNGLPLCEDGVNEPLVCLARLVQLRLGKDDMVPPACFDDTWFKVPLDDYEVRLGS